MSTSRSELNHASSENQPLLHHTRLGISLSGGGIRSATFSLGVCQQLIEHGILDRARYLSAVSGGSYLAAGLATSHALCPEKLQSAEPKPWGRGSPEEARLRGNLNYLAPGGRGRLWLFANLLYGLVLNLTPLVLAAFLCGGATGIILRLIYPGLGSGESLSRAALPWVLALVAALIMGAIAVVGHRRFLDKNRFRAQMEDQQSERNVAFLLGAAGATVSLFVVLPGILDLLTQMTASRVTAGLGLGEVTFPVRRMILGAAVLGASLGLGASALWLLRRRQMPALRGVLAYLSGIGILFAPFVLAAETAVVKGWSARTDGLLCLAALAVILLFAVLVHNRRYSMHLFYRERIQEAFASRRVIRDGALDVEPISYAEPVLLSEIARRNSARATGAGPPFPELVMCAAVAARGAEVPSKTWAASFTFEGDVSGNAKLGLQAPTKSFETGDWIGGGDLTLPAMMAISGAAVSPLMGRFTLPAFRFLMAMMNIRLGVWIHNPNWESDEKPLAELGTFARLKRYINRGWREPGAWYVLKEGLGLVNASGRYIYVSDGGHWENLGLTELLRRGCTHVIVVDASGDPGLGDMGRAMSVARAELGVEFKLDPRATLADDDSLAQSPVAVGSFVYPDGRKGTIFYARSVLWKDASSDLHLFAKHESRFPNHSTTNQFLSGELFDAYRALGWAVGENLVDVLSLPQKEFDEPPLGIGTS